MNQTEAMVTSRRIGLFGGSFNPIHMGHLKTAGNVLERFDLESIVFIPAASPPHKSTEGMAAAGHRLRMTELAVSEYASFLVSDIELNRKGPSYTIDTVKHFKSTLPPDATLYFVLGIDAFVEIDTWKSYLELFQLTAFIVMSRPGFGMSDGGFQKNPIEDFIKDKISKTYQFFRERTCFIHDMLQPIYLCEVLPMDISSSRIRELICGGLPVDHLVPEPVDTYLQRTGLYQ